MNRRALLQAMLAAPIIGQTESVGRVYSFLWGRHLPTYWDDNGNLVMGDDSIDMGGSVGAIRWQRGATGRIFSPSGNILSVGFLDLTHAPAAPLSGFVLDLTRCNVS